MKLEVIAYAHNGHTDKFGIPRQSREESPILTRIVFEPKFNVREALRGIEGFSHLWILWGFSRPHPSHAPQNNILRENVREPRSPQSKQPSASVCSGVPDVEEWSPTVRPPRLGGNKRVGVFATRSPFRPNPIGLSSVKLIEVRYNGGVMNGGTPSNGGVMNGDAPEVHNGGRSGRMELIVSGADVLDGTPVYDIKPYLSFSDSHPEAVNGFAEDVKDHSLEVDWSAVETETGGRDGSKEVRRTRNNALITRLSRANNALFTAKEQEEISYILQQDPRPGYQNDPSRVYKMDYAGWRVSFRVEGQIVRVVGIDRMTD
ncbi:MAG: SAM-dependent methyltransferase [Paludibacteraceae bacterium]|nr:SAM-dependent methyltransferase [Paludibacteraceae bacterium]